MFTGAGISTESGIPDFRSPGGIWTQMAPIYFDEFLASEEARRETWRRRFAMEDIFKAAEPNRGHRAVDALVRRGKVSAVITQNIDGLHEASGVPPRQGHRAARQHHLRDLPRLRRALRDRRSARRLRARRARCRRCGKCLGHVKTATVSFGQAMPVLAMQRAEEETLAADLFIVLGSSLVVYPAAGFPQLAKQNGATLVIVNREETGLDHIADLVLHEADRRHDGRGGRGELIDRGSRPHAADARVRGGTMRLEDKVALITGAASGMGASMARIFAREGAKVVVADMLDDEGKKIAAEIAQANGAAMFQPSRRDRARPNGRPRSRRRSPPIGKLDILVNDAGISGSAVEDLFDTAAWDKIMGINATGTFLGMKYAIPEMRKAGGGSIVNISSISGRHRPARHPRRLQRLEGRGADADQGGGGAARARTTSGSIRCIPG